MRIIHTCLRYPPATGGVETYVKELVTRTRDLTAQRDVRVLTSRLRTHWPMSALDPKQMLNDPPYIQRLHHVGTPFFAYPRLQALKHYLGHHQPDLIHGYSFWYQPADVAARYASKHNIPFVFHPMYYENSIRHKLSWQLYKRTIGRQTFAAASVVVVISPYEQALIEQAGFPVHRFILIPPGIDVAEITSSQADPFIPLHISHPIILCVSRLSTDKGISDVINALPNIIKSIPSVRLVIVGEDFGALGDLQQQVKHLGLAAHVHFLGRLSQTQLIGAYQHADLFLHPSRYEAFGIVVAQAMAAKLPVIARNTAALPFVAPHCQAGLLFNNQSEMINYVIATLSKPKYLSPFIAPAFSRVCNLFSWDKAEKKLTALYTELTHKD